MRLPSADSPRAWLSVGGGEGVTPAPKARTRDGNHTRGRRRLRMLLCMPVVGAQWENRASSRRVGLSALGGSLERLANSDVDVVLAVNGGDLSTELYEHLTTATTRLAAMSSGVEIKHYATVGKINTVNTVMRQAAWDGYDGFMVLDDDAVVEPQVLPEAVRFLQRRNPHVAALCFHKYSLEPVLYEHPSTFQREMVRLFHPAACRLLVDLADCGKRPSGSAYVLPRQHLRPFPVPCNEAEELAATRHEVATAAVRTWYPSSVAEEALRRYGHRLVNEKSPVPRPRKDRAFVLPWSEVAKRLAGRRRLGAQAELALGRAYELRLLAIRIADNIA